MASESPLSLNLDSNLGALLLGNLFAAGLYGVTCVQALTFFKKGYKDSIVFRMLVFFLWMLDTSHIALITHAIYHYLVSYYGDLTAVSSIVWSLIAPIFITCLSDLIVRCYFASRIWQVSKNNMLIGIITIASSVSFAAALAGGVRAFELKTFENLSEISYLIYLSFGCGVAADILITTSLCSTLMQHRNGFKKTDSILHMLLLYTINTTLLTSLCSIACLVTYAIWRTDKLIFVAVYFSFSKLYLISLFATLNTRQTLSESERFTGVTDLSLPLAETQVKNPSRSNTMSTNMGTVTPPHNGTASPVTASEFRHGQMARSRTGPRVLLRRPHQNVNSFRSGLDTARSQLKTGVMRAWEMVSRRNGNGSA
ncbi:hypothetical protein Hypma_003572 [Hypsizygus marmoreus]|uniref:DUF6534 domain-containing protein n=1 Tax=Hypsizygus marmoreus TaxID=39966 RepID=A0A369J8B4_HYPMA|nr:hypothetical protein Hypma_003572 [Hypsizygus marmoreus]